jgi:Uncharacterized protein conserved in bacteria
MGSIPDDFGGVTDHDGSGGSVFPHDASVAYPAPDAKPAGKPLGDGQDLGPAGRRKRRPGPAQDADADPDAVARAIVLRQLTGSAKSRKQLADKLDDRDVPPEVAQRVLDRFAELQLIDDAAFADSWVRGRARTRGLSRSALKRELRTKGIADELAAEALEQLSDADELGMARELVEKKVRSMPAGLERDKGVRRLVSMLGRKGYGPGVAFRVVNEVWPVEHG